MTEHQKNQNTEPGDSEIEVDAAVLANSQHSDYESAGYAASTDSLTSSINEYVFENGRRYHSYFGTEKNFMPTDEKEQDRLDLHHEIFLGLLNGKLHLAPLKEPHRILDIGTGTGIWAIDIADKYPMAEVLGTDLSPIQPYWVPPNCKFEVDDAEENFTFRDGRFDFVHARNLAQSISGWPKLMSEVYRITSPGGYAELSELDGTLLSDDNSMAPDNALKAVFDLINKEALPKIGRPPASIARLRAYLEDAGFVDVKVVSVKHPYGPWAKDKRLKQIGAMCLLNMETAIEAYVMACAIKILGMQPEVATTMCQNALKAVRNKNNHMYSYFHTAYGRKPE